jgi:hypothetical protein
MIGKKQYSKRDGTGISRPVFIPRCTGQCPMRQAARRWTGCSRENTEVYGYNSPDCLVVHRTVWWPTVLSANGRLRNPRATRGPQQRSVGHTGLSGAPTDPEDQRLDAPDMEGDRTSDNYSDCPVVHWTARCTTRQKASMAFQVGLQRLLAALGLYEST